MNIDITTRYKIKKGVGGRFKRAEKVKKFWKTWDSAVNIPEKQLNPRDYEHRNSLVDKIKLSKKEAEDYKMRIIGDDKTIKMYEEYYKTNRYT